MDVGDWWCNGQQYLIDRLCHYVTDFDQTAHDRFWDVPGGCVDIEIEHNSLSRKHCSLATWSEIRQPNLSRFGRFVFREFVLVFCMEQFEAITHVDDDLILVAMDHGSTNGTFINKSRLEKALLCDFGASLFKQHEAQNAGREKVQSEFWIVTLFMCVEVVRKIREFSDLSGLWCQGVGLKMKVADVKHMVFGECHLDQTCKIIHRLTGVWSVKVIEDYWCIFGSFVR